MDNRDTPAPATGRPRVQPTRRDTTTAAGKFHADMLALYDTCATLGFRPVLLRRAVVLQGGVAAARDLVFKPAMTGLERLIDLGKKDSSMEAMMLRPQYRALFAPLELKEAEKRLAEHGRERSRGRLESPRIKTSTEN